jgi:nucleoside-diphosphate-sugar epimerase
MRTVLVTGGAGFIGSHLVEKLLEGGGAVRVLDNLSTGSLANLQAAAGRQARGGGLQRGGRLEVIIGDVRERELLRKALRNVKYVFHLAALPASPASIRDSAEVHAVNVEGTLNVLHGALTEGVWRVVVGSCASVYGTPDTHPVAEDAALRPTSLFGASKVAAETYCRAFHARHQLETVVLRYFTVYGPRQRPNPRLPLLPNVIEAVRHRRPFVDQAEVGTDDFIHVDDAVAATLAAVRAPRAAGHAVNVGSGQTASLGDVVHILGGLLRSTGSTALTRSVGARPRHLTADTSRAAELLGFSPRVSLIAGLARLVRVLNETDELERLALAPVGLDD